MVLSRKIFWFKDRDQKKMETFFKLDPLFDKGEMLKEMRKTAREERVFSSRGRPTIKALFVFNNMTRNNTCVTGDHVQG